MGLDLVELVMEVEDEFEMTIPDADAEHIETVGQLHEYVLTRLGLASARRSTPAVCGTARSFYRLRGAFAAAGVARAMMVPSAEWTRWPDAAERWAHVADRLNLRFQRPPLPPHLMRTLHGFAAAALLVALASGGILIGARGWVPAWATVAGAIGVLTLVSRALQNRLPEGCHTVGGLAR